jgi:transcriptional regulator with XRE-family HTH domain
MGSVAAPPTPEEVQFARRLRALRETAHLTQGELAKIFSAENQVGAASISSWENQRQPSALPRTRLEPYARLFSVSPVDGSYVLVPEGELTPEQLARRDEMLDELQELWEETRGGNPRWVRAHPTSTYRSWSFEDDGPAVIVAPQAPPSARGPLSDPLNPNYNELHLFADADSLIELHGHIRAENQPLFRVFFKRATQVEVDDMSGHLVLLGGVAWNDLTAHLLRSLRRLPVRQMAVPELDSGEIFAVGHGGKERHFEPVWRTTADGKVLEEDVALLARLVNPYNSNRTLTLCNGVHSRGVYGAVRTLTDAQLRDTNESYLAERFPGGEFALLMRVPVYRGRASTPDLRNPEHILYEWPPRESEDASRRSGA